MVHFHQYNSRSAFTLIELSIVLVIIGLVVGGVLVGQDLIKAAQLRAVVSDVDQYNTAINTFRLKYNKIPGDITNATTFWGKDNTNCSGDTGTVATPGTCNGDGDKIIEWASDGTDESFRVWQHLSLAGLIADDMPGTHTAGVARVGTNIPETDVPRAGIHVSYWSNIWSTGVGGHFFLLGNETANPGTNNEAALSPLDTMGIDQKIDDGEPDSGKVLAYDGWPASHDCVTGSVPNRTYDLTSSDKECRVYFMFK